MRQFRKTEKENTNNIYIWIKVAKQYVNVKNYNKKVTKKKRIITRYGHMSYQKNRYGHIIYIIFFGMQGYLYKLKPQK